MLSILLVVLAACSSEGEDLEPDFSEEDWHYWSMDRADAGYVPGLIQYDGQDIEVKAQVRGDTVLLQGDIMMGRHSEIGNQAAIISSKFWNNSTVPYTIRDDIPLGTRSAIADAVNFYNTKTNVRWVKRTTERDYVEFFPGSGCWSYVGRNGGKQQISLGSGCGYSSIAQHEMGHAIGFHHEQSRTDRDQHIRLDCSAVPCGDINWKLIGEAGPYGEYDFRSIMHYGAFRGGKQVIFPVSNIDPREIGRSSNLTSTDIAAVNYLYKRTNPEPEPEPEPDPEPANFPVNLQGATPEEKTVNLSADKPSGMDNAILKLAVFDPDFADEGALYINGKGPVTLFGNSIGGDRSTKEVSFTMPAAWWNNGDNSLRFVHTRTQGYRVDKASVRFNRNPEPEPTGETYSNSLSGSGYYRVEPNGNYYRGDAGTHKGSLSGPANANFDLRLWRWNGRG